MGVIRLYSLNLKQTFAGMFHLIISVLCAYTHVIPLCRPDDLALMIWLYKLTREYARRMPCYRGEHVPGHPVFSETSAAQCRSDASPVDTDASDIEYTEEDNNAIEIYMRNYSKNCFHQMSVLLQCAN